LVVYMSRALIILHGADNGQPINALCTHSDTPRVSKGVAGRKR